MWIIIWKKSWGWLLKDCSHWQARSSSPGRSGGRAFHTRRHVGAVWLSLTCPSMYQHHSAHSQVTTAGGSVSSSMIWSSSGCSSGMNTASGLSLGISRRSVCQHIWLISTCVAHLYWNCLCLRNIRFDLMMYFCFGLFSLIFPFRLRPHTTPTGFLFSGKDTEVGYGVRWRCAQPRILDYQGLSVTTWNMSSQ